MTIVQSESIRCNNFYSADKKDKETNLGLDDRRHGRTILPESRQHTELSIEDKTHDRSKTLCNDVCVIESTVLCVCVLFLERRITDHRVGNTRSIGENRANVL